MTTITLSKIKASDLKPLVQIEEQGIAPYPWLQLDTVTLTEQEQQQLTLLQDRLLNERTLLMNEATVWARAIYPLLLLAERDSIQAWAQVELSAQYKNFSITGISDSVLGHCLEGELKTPYLIVVEAKRGLEAENPKYQLYGQMLAAAWLNWQSNQRDRQVIFGCYTVADTWTFVRAEVTDLDADKPRFWLESSRDYVEKLEAATILRILKQIVSETMFAHRVVVAD